MMHVSHVMVVMTKRDREVHRLELFGGNSRSNSRLKKQKQESIQKLDNQSFRRKLKTCIERNSRKMKSNQVSS